MPNPLASIYTAQPTKGKFRKETDESPPSEPVKWEVRTLQGTLKGVFGPHRTAFMARQEAATVLNIDPSMLSVKLLDLKAKPAPKSDDFDF